jgi:SET domain-containing protein
MSMKHLPHERVYARLRSSRIHGVGVVAIRDIPKGTPVFAEDDEDILWIEKKDIGEVPPAIRELYEDFCVAKGDKYGCPKDFDKLTVAWYLNHSDEPNVVADENYRFYALRDIKAGEELTADYNTYSDAES